MNKQHNMLAPDWQVLRWFNTAAPLSLRAFRGRVILLEAFQMLCPGCVSHALPQAKRVAELFPSEQVAVIGLHSVFEHHAAMNPAALAAFLHEYRIGFPVAVDAMPVPNSPTSQNVNMPMNHIRAMMIARHWQLLPA